MPKVMQPGQLDRKINVFQRVSIRDEAGERTHVYDPFIDGIPARKDEVSGVENATPSGRQTSTDTVLFTVRFREDITAQMRVVCDGVVYDVENVREGEVRKQWTILETKRRS